MQYGENVVSEGGMTLVNALYFMTEAFRNRKEALSDFIEEFQEIVDLCLDKDADIVILRAFVCSMALFDEHHLQRSVLHVFDVEYFWLNDVAVENCWSIRKLEKTVEQAFCNYIGHPSFIIKLHFMENDFSLSLSKGYSFIRLYYWLSIPTLIVCQVFFILTVFLSFLLILPDFFTLYNLKFNDFGFNRFRFICFAALLIIALAALFMSTLRELTVKMHNFFVYSKNISLLQVFSAIISFIKSLFRSFVRIVKNAFFLFLYNLIAILLSEFSSSLIRSISRSLSDNNIISSLRCFFTLFFFGTAFILYLQKIESVHFSKGDIAKITIPFRYLQDRLWIKRQPDLKHLDRVIMKENLEILRTSQGRRKYVNHLLQMRVKLKGDWPDGKRPTYDDDSLDRLLAMLDCASIDAYNYRF